MGNWATQFKAILHKSAPVSKWKVMSMTRNELYSVGVRESPNFETDFQNYTSHRCWIVFVNAEKLKTNLPRSFTVEGDLIPIIRSTTSLEVSLILTTITAKPCQSAEYLYQMATMDYVLYAWDMDQ
ncbi:hypothetical protein L596_001884 [Steinernema carpocapsae]|uniref:Uncharacterized protein n=1 Tax=Steinernema carpocapsae TaxID=34508 RepID=A0A4U8UMW2_STECR|nr:hypothetical protein L596_001884 [Steinernema carpocapsae]